MKKENKKCRDCGKRLGDVDLYWRSPYLYCAEDYQVRFGVWPGFTQTPEQGSTEE